MNFSPKFKLDIKKLNFISLFKLHFLNKAIYTDLASILLTKAIEYADCTSAEG